MTHIEFKDVLNEIGHGYTGAIPKREIFSIAKEFKSMPVTEVIELLKTQNNDYKLGAISILDWKARDKNTSLAEKEALFYAYLDNHKFIDNWGLVDRAAPYVVGGFLFDKSREPLYRLAKSKNEFERRTAIVSTYFFIRKNDIKDTFKIAEMLIHDSEQTVQTAVGSWIREAGKKDTLMLQSFLDEYAATMPRITLRYALEKMDKEVKAYYMNLKNSTI